jgi:hypothetical protein
LRLHVVDVNNWNLFMASLRPAGEGMEGTRGPGGVGDAGGAEEAAEEMEVAQEVVHTVEAVAQEEAVKAEANKKKMCWVGAGSVTGQAHTHGIEVNNVDPLSIKKR